MENFIPAQCAARSLGPANQLVNLLIQALLSSYCTISNPGWPDNCQNPIDGETFDFIIVGAGTSGSVVAGRLSENPDFKVLVLEAGGDPPIESEIPGEAVYLQRTDVDWQYSSKRKHACLATETRSCAMPRGKMLGGSSSMNYMLMVRGNKHNYDYWESLGNKGWCYESVLKYFKRWEANRDAIIANYDHGYYHNRTGPVNVEFFLRYPYVKVFLCAAKERGHKEIIDINADKTVGFLHTQAFIYNGVRQSAAKAYLIPAKNRPNLCIRKHSQVYKILFDENKRAIGVQYNYDGKKNFTAYARKEVILSAGVVESAHLLLLSGVGPKNELEKFKIPVICDSPVGQTFYDHVAPALFFQFEGEAPPATEAFDDTYDYLIKRGGVLSSAGAFELEGFWNIKNHSKWPNIELSPLFFTQNSSGLEEFLGRLGFASYIREKLKEVNKKYYVGVACVSLVQPKSIGNVKLRTSSYTDHPVISANYFDHPEDEETVLHAVKHVLSFEKTKAFKQQKGKFISLPICGEFKFKSDDYWLCYNRHMSISELHAVGTSKMGPKYDPTSVVCPKLLVRGVKGLSQADLGVAPYMPSGNTNALALMIGEKAAALINKRHSHC